MSGTVELDRRGQQRSEQRRIVVALGGNAIQPPHTPGTAERLLHNLERACLHLVPIIAAGHQLVVTHGNGPQVGELLLALEERSEGGVRMDVCVGMTQGEIGTLLEQALINALAHAGIEKDVVTILTHVLIDPEDPELSRAAKPIGMFMDEMTARNFERERGHQVALVGKDPGRPYRRVVPSPTPIRLLEHRAVRALSAAGSVVIAAGGGGVPLVQAISGDLYGVEAVVDKDLAGAKLAELIDADIYMILTDVETIAIDYATPNERRLRRLAVSEARLLLAAGQFPPGSMGPKVRACIEFVERGGGRAVITSIEAATRALAGEAGTEFVR
ncbi:MAG: carbamate kinase [Dehalococcoidia bacterium]